MKNREVQTHSLRGIGIGRGGAEGKLRFFQKLAPRTTHRYRGPEAETDRLCKAIQTVKQELDTAAAHTKREIGESEAEIFEIHAMLLSDEDLTEAMQALIEEGMCAEEACKRAAERYATHLAGLSDPYLRARAADLRDLSHQVEMALSGERPSRVPDDGEPYILVARDLSPSETVGLDKGRILGFVTFEGSPNSHTAILARAMGIPALVGVGAFDTTQNGTYALLDAEEGSLILSPDEAAVQAFRRKRERESIPAREHAAYLKSLINKPAVTRSGRRVLIYANVGDGSEAESARLHGADGIGLLRSEFLYLSRDRYPTEEELFRAYCDVATAMEGKRIIIRTLDIGADKQIDYFHLAKEENPALGCRGVRLCLKREELFKTQLRAILRAAAHGNISLMVPMIVGVDEVKRCRHLLEVCGEELLHEGKRFDPHPEFGIMIETPAAAIMAEELAAVVDFFSVGTNDLLQYTLAADRQNAAVSDLCADTEPVLRLIKHASDAIHSRGGWIGICGELAADLHLTQRFADMGIDELSVSVPYLLGVREKVTECK